MRNRRPRSFQLLRKSFIALLTATTLGCGGGGGGDALAPAGGGGGGGAGGGILPQTFRFPGFTNNSKLTVIANFQTAAEAPTNQVGQLTATLANLGGVVPRAAFRADPSSPDSAGLNPCGYADACAMEHMIGDTLNSGVPQPQIRRRFQELPEGAQEDFFLASNFVTVTGEKILQPNETTHCTIFAEVINGNPVVDRAKALAVAEAFDSNNPQRPGSGIYDQVRAVFGSEWNQNPTGGNDGDTKVVLFFFSSQTAGSGLFGFVSPADGNPAGGALSNKGEIIYINADKDPYQTLATISHEFQHLVNQNEKVNQQGLNPANKSEENISVNEGLSGLAEEVCGYTFDSGNQLLVSVTNDYLGSPEDHEFFDFFEAGLGYGQGYLFFKYVREHFGDSTIRAICTDPDTGLANLNEHLPLGFSETFRRWTIANYATNLGGSVPNIYRYPSGFRTNGTYAAGTLVGVNTQAMGNDSENQSGNIKPWSVRYMVFNGNSNGLTATVLGATGSPFGVIFEGIENTFTSFDD